MIKLAKYLKPFIPGLIIAIILLFAQAVFDLNLPNYMSNIVNVGIQQNGIAESTPAAISPAGYTFISTFMSADEKALLNASYSLKSGTDQNKRGRRYEELYPAAASSPIYVLADDLSQETVDQLDTAFGTAVWTMINVMRSLADAGAGVGAGMGADAGMGAGAGVGTGASVGAGVGAGASAGTSSSAGAGTGTGTSTANINPSALDIQSIDITQVYKMQPLLTQLPPAIFAAARDAALQMDATLLKKSATMMVSVFYKELGLDIVAYQRNYIIRVGLLMLLLALGSGAATILVSLLSSRIAAGTARDLRNDIFEKVSRFSTAEFDRFSTASLITRSTNDVMQIQMLLAIGIRMVCYAPIMGIGGVIMALEKSTSMSWIIAAACAVLLGLIMIIFAVAMPKFKMMQKLVDRINLVARETLNGLPVIRAFSTSQFEKERFDNANKDLTRTGLFITRTVNFLMPIMMLIMNGVSLLIIWVGAHQVAQSQMQVGDMMAFMQYAMQIITSFLLISMMFIFIPRASVSAQRIAEILETDPSIIDPDQPQAMDEFKRGYVEFRNVSFRYDGAEEDALKNISFVARPGETIAFIGSTGAGKTTLVRLIPRFFDTTSGEVLVNGVNVKELSQKELRSRIGYVPQKSVLMSGTIASNIKYGNEAASEAEVEQAARIAQALSFISEKPEGFNAEIAQGGTNVSGGQKQRLAIARAIAVKPDIFIFDDCFSALDFKTDAALRKALKEHTADSTVIMVAQRVSTIMNANQIYVLNEGKIVGHGTHQELLNTCPEYYEIAASQFSKEELRNA
ncbi:MAG: ABC transporter ATP-binding protein [Bacillota bacterium]|jgi:ATP-binding cassette subfamily B multidrug efflux pump